MERLTKRTDKGILVKEDYGENALRTLYQCFDAEPNTHYINCEEGYCAIEKLAAYEDLGVTPEQIKEFSSIYLDKCEEVNRLNAELAELKKQPQGDLISRSATMENYCNALCPKSEKGEYCENCIVKSWMNNQSTAYNVEKVVEQLDKNCFSPDNYPGYAVDAELVVDIVRAGGKE